MAFHALGPAKASNVHCQPRTFPRTPPPPPYEADALSGIFCGRIFVPVTKGHGEGLRQKVPVRTSGKGFPDGQLPQKKPPCRCAKGELLSQICDNRQHLVQWARGVHLCDRRYQHIGPGVSLFTPRNPVSDVLTGTCCCNTKNPLHAVPTGTACPTLETLWLVDNGYLLLQH